MRDSIPRRLNKQTPDLIIREKKSVRFPEGNDLCKVYIVESYK